MVERLLSVPGFISITQWVICPIVQIYRNYIYILKVSTLIFKCLKYIIMNSHISTEFPLKPLSHSEII